MRWVWLVLLVPTLVFAEEPRAILQNAIAAHGGQEVLSAVRAERVKLRGSFHYGDIPLSFTNDLTLQLPEQFKSVITIPSMGTTAVNILDGVNATTLVNDKSVPISPETMAELRQTLAQERALRLVPLLRDPGVRLTHLGEYTIDGRLAVGVGVQRQGQRDLKLFFDRRTNLLVTCEHQLTGTGGKTFVHQARYSDHRLVGGHVRATRITVYRDGKKAMEAELLEARRVDKIDPSEFQTR